MLMGLAYRVLGSVAEAEDVVQDTFLAWMDADHGTIVAPRRWLTTVCTRKAVDVLRSARRVRTDYVGTWLPEPAHTEVLETPETQLALSESVTTAFLLTLERLAPKERAAFLLHDVFAMEYNEIATNLDVTEAACRKLVSRARANVQRTDDLYPAPQEHQNELVAAFSLAITTGSTEKLAELLSADATLSADSGGKVVGIRKTLEGAEAVLDFVEKVLSPVWRTGEISVEDVNSGPSLVVRQGDDVFAVVTFAYTADSKASRIFIMRNPDKLARLDRELDFKIFS